MNKPKKFVSLFLVFSLLALSGNLMAKKRGAELKIQKKDGQQVRGELIAVKEKSLLLLDAEGVDVSVDISDVKVITIVKKSKATEWAFLGILVGGGIGTLLAYQKRETSYSPGFGSIGAGLGCVVGGVLFGGLIGGAAGEEAGKNKIIQIEGKHNSAINIVLEKLRKKARIPDYQ